MKRAAKVDWVRLERILQLQHYVIGRDQAFSCGLTRKALSHRLRPGGPWQKLLPGVYLALTGAVSTDQRQMAALLHAGPGSVLTGDAAVRRHGIRAPGSTVVDVLIPATRRCQSVGFVRIQRTVRMPSQFCATGQIRFTMSARAVADAARAMQSHRNVRALVSDAIQKRRCTITMLGMELEQGPVRGSRLLRRALNEVQEGIRSVAEGDFRDLLVRARLPLPVFNARLFDGEMFLASVDGWWPDSGVAAEVDSREYHLSAENWQRTTERHDRLVAKGILLLHFTPQRMRKEPAGIVAEIRSALAAGRGRAVLPITARPAAA